MHDIDRTLAELDPMSELDPDEGNDEFGEDEFDDEGYHTAGFEDEGDDEFYGDHEFGDADDDAGFAGELEPMMEGSPFSDAEELELAGDLLAVGTEDELDQFLGSVIRRAAKKVRRVIKSPVVRRLTRVVKPFAKKYLNTYLKTFWGPTAGRVAGGILGGPMGARIGGQAASQLGGLLGFQGYELEGLAPEEADFEIARRVVRLAGATGRNAAYMPNVGSSKAARLALARAARVHAPGFAAGSGAPAAGGSGASGRWVRRGRNIILIGV